MSILGSSSNVVIDNAKMSNAGRDVRTTTQHANSVFTSSSEQTIVMEQPNVLNAGGNITYITWNFQLLELAAAALSLVFSPFRTRIYTTYTEPDSEPDKTASCTLGVRSADSTVDDENIVTTDRFPSSDSRETISSHAPISCKTYTESMLRIGIGYPLWFPQPTNDLPIDYRRTGVSFGDVGIITFDGDFDFLFNVLKPAKDPINIPADLPVEFDAAMRPEVRQRLRKSYPNDASTLSNLQNIKTDLNGSTKEISFLCKDGAAGAILSLPHGALENDVRNEGRWKQFISENALSWYRYARDNCDRDVDRHSLYFITGYMKSKTWGITTFDTPVPTRDNVLIMEKSTRPKDPPYVWKKFEGASVYKSGPSPDPELAVEDGDNDVENQCLFLRGFKISLSEQTWKELSDVTYIGITNEDSRPQEGKHGPGKETNSKGKDKVETRTFSSSHGNFGNGANLSSFPLRNVPFHPSTIINDMLMSLVPEARIAVTHDSVWMDIAHLKDYEDYESNEMLATIFGSRFVTSHCKKTGMCTFESIEELVPMFRQAGSLNEYSCIALLESFTTICDNCASIGMTTSAAFLELFTNILVGKDHSDPLTSMYNLAVTYCEKGKWSVAKNIQKQVLDMHTEMLGKEHPYTLASMRNLAVMYYKQDRWADAEDLQRQVLEMRTRILGKEHPDTLASMHELAVTHYSQGKWVDTQNLESQVLAMHTRILGKEHPDTLTSMHGLALAYYKQGRWADAKNLQIQVLEMRTRILGKEHLETLASMHGLALTFYKLDRWADAEDLQSQMLEIRTRILGKEHLDTLASMHELSVTYYNQDKWTDAENLQIQVLEICTRILGKEHPRTLAIMHELAVTYYEHDRWADAENLQSQILETLIRILGNEHPDVLSSMHELAFTYYEQGKWTYAENLECQVLEMRTRMLGKEHPDTLASMHALALTYYKHDRWADTENLQSQLLEIRTRMLGKEHPVTLSSMRNLAMTYYKQKRWTEAKNVQSQVLEMRTRISGKAHPETLDSMHELALTYCEQDRWADAENLQSQVLEMRTRIIGKEHPDTLASMYNLAVTYYQQDRWTEAENLQRKALEMHTRILGKEHPGTLDSMYNLAMIYFKQDKWTEAENLHSQVLKMRTRILGKEHPDTLASEYHLNLIRKLRIEKKEDTKIVPDMTDNLRTRGENVKSASARKKGRDKHLHGTDR